MSDVSSSIRHRSVHPAGQPSPPSSGAIRTTAASPGYTRVTEVTEGQSAAGASLQLTVCIAFCLALPLLSQALLLAVDTAASCAQSVDTCEYVLFYNNLVTPTVLSDSTAASAGSPTASWIDQECVDQYWDRSEQQATTQLSFELSKMGLQQGNEQPGWIWLLILCHPDVEVHIAAPTPIPAAPPGQERAGASVSMTSQVASI